MFIPKWKRKLYKWIKENQYKPDGWMSPSVRTKELKEFIETL